MENKLNEYLLDGEEVLWTGAPKVTLLDKVYKSKYLMKVAIVAALALGVLGFYVYYLSANEMPLKLSFMVIVMGIAAVILAVDVQDVKKLNQALYAVTDQRLIAVVGKTADAVELWKIQEHAFEEDEAGQVSLMCGGEGVQVKPWKRREKTVIGPRYDAKLGICDCFVLYGIPEADKVKALLADKI